MVTDREATKGELRQTAEQLLARAEAAEEVIAELAVETARWRGLVAWEQASKVKLATVIDDLQAQLADLAPSADE